MSANHSSGVCYGAIAAVAIQRSVRAPISNSSVCPSQANRLLLGEIFRVVAMFRPVVVVLFLSAFLSACAPTSAPQLGADGLPLPKIYRISNASKGKIQFRMLDSVNVLRQAAGATPVQLNAALNAAAATHSRDMANQNRPWHFGSDGSSPIDRALRVGYSGNPLGENISETFETELQTLAAWMDQPDTRAIILDTNARDLGFSWYQEPNGKIWWTLVTGG